MGDDILTTEQALQYMLSQGYAWSKKTLLNYACGAQAQIRKTRRGKNLFFKRADLDAFIRHNSKITVPFGVR